MKILVQKLSMCALVFAFAASPLVVSSQTAVSTPAQIKAEIVKLQAQAADIQTRIAKLEAMLGGSSKTSVEIKASQLKLEYDQNKKESSINAGFEVIVKAGSESVVYPSKPGSAFQIQLIDTGGTRITYANATYTLPPQFVVKGDTAVLPAGKTASIKVYGKFNPKVLFAGTYSARIWDINMVNGQAQIPDHKTNFVTIIGEVSPYVTGVFVSSKPTETTVYITGVRFLAERNTVRIQGKTESKDLILPATGLSEKGMMQISFVPSKYGISAGEKELYVINLVTGLSNRAVFTLDQEITQEAKVTVKKTDFKTVYDSQQRESVLVATVHATIQAGSQAIEIPQNGAVLFARDPQNSLTQSTVRTDVQYASASQLRTVYPMLLKPGTITDVQIVGRFNPKTMFAGTYSAGLDLVFTTSNYEKYLKPAFGVYSNALVVVGEQSPYITGGTLSVATSTKPIVLTGVRFAEVGNVVKIDEGLAGAKSFTIISTPVAGTEKRNISFVPGARGIKEGRHSITVTHPTTGQSNMVYFTVGSNLGSINHKALLYSYVDELDYQPANAKEALGFWLGDLFGMDFFK